MRVITGKARGAALRAPDGLLTRPTADRVKVALFNILQFELAGRRVLDLFAGSGQLGIEALSRGAASAVFVDCRKEAIQVIRENLNHTKLAPLAEVVQADYLAYLSACRSRFDLILLDPPYAEIFLENALQKISEIDILSDGGIIVTERPIDKPSAGDFRGFTRSKDYKYGKTYITVYRRERTEDRL